MCVRRNQQRAEGDGRWRGEDDEVCECAQGEGRTSNAGEVIHIFFSRFFITLYSV